MASIFSRLFAPAVAQGAPQAKPFLRPERGMPMEDQPMIRPGSTPVSPPAPATLPLATRPPAGSTPLPLPDIPSAPRPAETGPIELPNYTSGQRVKGALLNALYGAMRGAATAQNPLGGAIGGALAGGVPSALSQDLMDDIRYGLIDVPREQFDYQRQAERSARELALLKERGAIANQEAQAEEARARTRSTGIRDALAIKGEERAARKATIDTEKDQLVTVGQGQSVFNPFSGKVLWRGEDPRTNKPLTPKEALDLAEMENDENPAVIGQDAASNRSEDIRRRMGDVNWSIHTTGRYPDKLDSNGNVIERGRAALPEEAEAAARLYETVWSKVREEATAGAEGARKAKVRASAKKIYEQDRMKRTQPRASVSDLARRFPGLFQPPK